MSVTREDIYHDALQRIVEGAHVPHCDWCSGTGYDHDDTCPVTWAKEALAWAPLVGRRGP
jgi:hypothetical protein